MGLYNFNEMMTPFWNSDTMYGESLLMVSENGSPAAASLLFNPDEVLSVMNSHLDIQYREGVDWTLEGRTLKLLPGSSIPFMQEQEFYPAAPEEGESFPRVGGGYVLFHEGTFFHDHQITVTYKHSDKWSGSIPQCKKSLLPETVKRLKSGKPFRLALYGDSIAYGANASGMMGAPPYLPNWGNLVSMKLQHYYKSPVAFINPSVGGMNSVWGKENVEKLVAAENPDLAIIAFGMNDGTGQIPPDEFIGNITAIMASIREKCPGTEYILVASILPNHETFFWGQQENYLPELQKLEGPGCAIADMTSIHRELLRHKKLRDMTGNNINHPNDFLTRWYAQVISRTIIGEG